MVKFVNTSKGQFTILYLPLKTNKQTKKPHITLHFPLALFFCNTIQKALTYILMALYKADAKFQQNMT